TFLNERKYDRVLAAIETRLTDLGISGKIGRLTPFTNARGLIRDEEKRGVKTIVVVGNDETVAKVVDGLGDSKVTLGIIPVGVPAAIAVSLGIPEGEEACDVLSKRITQKIDLGRINGHFFISSVHIPKGRLLIEGEGRYRISTLVEQCEVIVSNLMGGGVVLDERAGACAGDPKDGFLDTVITPRCGNFRGFFRSKLAAASSVIPLRKVNITSDEPISVVTDGRAVMSDKLFIEIVPDRLRVITGKERAFV
ncbi:MAG: diacylglycerol kinase family protein, partial [Patescibacteria group bacterium]